MNDNRPRRSILDLFDPLASHESTDSSPDSDKENTNPSPSPGEPAAQFIRTYKTPQPVTPAPTRRLVDVGDSPTTSISVGSATDGAIPETKGDQDEVEEDENATLTFRDMEFSCSPKSPQEKAMSTFATRMLRTPLAELILGDEAPPAPKPKTYKRHFVPSTPFPAINATGYHTSDKVSYLSSLINQDTTTFSDTTNGNSPPATPEIKISRADEQPDPVSQREGWPLAHSIADDSSTQGAPSPEPALNSSFLRLNTESINLEIRPNRMSIDLNSSFQLHFSSPDTTFDLLNDNVSGMDSMLAAVDETFDLEEERVKMQNSVLDKGEDFTDINASEAQCQTGSIDLPVFSRPSLEGQALSEGVQSCRNAAPVSESNKPSSAIVYTSLRRTSSASSSALPQPDIVPRIVRPPRGTAVDKKLGAASAEPTAPTRKLATRTLTLPKSFSSTQHKPSTTISGIFGPRRVAIIDSKASQPTDACAAREAPIPQPSMMRGPARVVAKAVPKTASSSGPKPPTKHSGNSTNSAPPRLVTSRLPTLASDQNKTKGLSLGKSSLARRLFSGQ